MGNRSKPNNQFIQTKGKLRYHGGWTKISLMAILRSLAQVENRMSLATAKRKWLVHYEKPIESKF